MPQRPHILSVAPDSCFRTTSEELFKRAGYVVTSLSTTAEPLQTLCDKGHTVDIVVICDCVPAEERLWFVAALKTACPAVPILLIGEKREPLINGVIRLADGPQAMLNQIARLLAQSGWAQTLTAAV